MNHFDFRRLNADSLVDTLSKNLNGRDGYVIVAHPAGSFFVGHMLIDRSIKNVAVDVVKKGSVFAQGAAFTLVLRAGEQYKEEKKRGEEESSEGACDWDDEPATPAVPERPCDLFRGPFPPDFEVAFDQTPYGVDHNIAILRVSAQPGFERVAPAEKEDERPQKRKRELVPAHQSAPRFRVHKLPLYDFHMDDIAARHKTLEARIFDGIFTKMRTGDIIEFFNKRRQRPVLVRLVRATRYKNFQEMFVAEGIAPFMPRKATLPVQVAVDVYRSFPKYRDKEHTCGVVALQLDSNIDQDRRQY